MKKNASLVALVGFGVGRKFDLDMQTLARVNIYALLPALVLTSLAQTTLALGSALAIVATFLLNTALLYLTGKRKIGKFKVKPPLWRTISTVGLGVFLTIKSLNPVASGRTLPVGEARTVCLHRCREYVTVWMTFHHGTQRRSQSLGK